MPQNVVRWKFTCFPTKLALKHEVGINEKKFPPRWHLKSYQNTISIKILIKSLIWWKTGFTIGVKKKKSLCKYPPGSNGTELASSTPVNSLWLRDFQPDASTAPTVITHTAGASGCRPKAESTCMQVAATHPFFHRETQLGAYCVPARESRQGKSQSRSRP